MNFNDDAPKSQPSFFDRVLDARNQYPNVFGAAVAFSAFAAMSWSALSMSNRMNSRPRQGQDPQESTRQIYQLRDEIRAQLGRIPSLEQWQRMHELYEQHFRADSTPSMLAISRDIALNWLNSAEANSSLSSLGPNALRGQLFARFQDTMLERHVVAKLNRQTLPHENIPDEELTPQRIESSDITWRRLLEGTSVNQFYNLFTRYAGRPAGEEIVALCTEIGGQEGGMPTLEQWRRLHQLIGEELNNHPESPLHQYRERLAQSARNDFFRSAYQHLVTDRMQDIVLQAHALRNVDQQAFPDEQLTRENLDHMLWPDLLRGATVDQLYELIAQRREPEITQTRVERPLWEETPPAGGFSFKEQILNNQIAQALSLPRAVKSFLPEGRPVTFWRALEAEARAEAEAAIARHAADGGEENAELREQAKVRYKTIKAFTRAIEMAPEQPGFINNEEKFRKWFSDWINTLERDKEFLDRTLHQAIPVLLDCAHGRNEGYKTFKTMFMHDQYQKGALSTAEVLAWREEEALLAVLSKVIELKFKAVNNPQIEPLELAQTFEVKVGKALGFTTTPDEMRYNDARVSPQDIDDAIHVLQTFRKGLPLEEALKPFVDAANRGLAARGELLLSDEEKTYSLTFKDALWEDDSLAIQLEEKFPKKFAEFKEVVDKSIEGHQERIGYMPPASKRASRDWKEQANAVMKRGEQWNAEVILKFMKSYDDLKGAVSQELTAHKSQEHSGLWKPQFKIAEEDPELRRDLLRTAFALAREDGIQAIKVEDEQNISSIASPGRQGAPSKPLADWLPECWVAAQLEGVALQSSFTPAKGSYDKVDDGLISVLEHMSEDKIRERFGANAVSTVEDAKTVRQKQGCKILKLDEEGNAFIRSRSVPRNNKMAFEKISASLLQEDLKVGVCLTNEGKSHKRAASGRAGR